MRKIANDKLTNHKLKLNRQTVAVLSTAQLGDVAGGMPPTVSTHTICTTCD
jgi:hypothetical protein